jgi:hypothetical protein
VAIPLLLLVQVPPETISLSVIVDPVLTNVLPVIGESGFTVILFVEYDVPQV